LAINNEISRLTVEFNFQPNCHDETAIEIINNQKSSVDGLDLRWTLIPSRVISLQLLA
jgi:hypothetical protein